MLRLLCLNKLYREYGIDSVLVILSPYGFWYAAEVLLGTEKHSTKILNTMLLFPVPVLNVFALLSYFLRYTIVKMKMLSVMGFSRAAKVLSILPLAFYIIILRSEI